MSREVKECVRRLRPYRCEAVYHGGRNACNMWFDNVEVSEESLSSAVKHNMM